MLIGEVAEITGLSRDTIRFYERKKLLKVKRTKSDWNNYKDYDDDNLRRLLLIKKCKGFGFTLSEIGNIFSLMETDDATCDLVTDRVHKKIWDIERKIHDLQQLKKMILNQVEVSFNDCVGSSGKSANCPELNIAIDEGQASGPQSQSGQGDQGV